MFNAWIIFLMASYTWEDVFPDLAWVTDWQIEMQWRRPPLHKLILYFFIFLFLSLSYPLFLLLYIPFPASKLASYFRNYNSSYSAILKFSKINPKFYFFPKKIQNHRGVTAKITGIATSLLVSFEIFIFSLGMSKAPGI